jgi:hypothetical protein
MGAEGISPDNALFEQNAGAAGVDAVFSGHIKGQWQYMADGVPYYTDGGAGGEVYVGPGEETGVDYGYWHGYRLLRVRHGTIRTDTVPVFSPGGITIAGPGSLARGKTGDFTAIGQQPTHDGPDVDLELRDPDPSRPNFVNLPTPARIWTSGDRRILRPVADDADDPRRDPRRQTISGRFRGRCPGQTALKVKSGWEQESFPVTVPSDPGALVESIQGGGSLEPGRPEPVATVRLAQAARVLVLVRGGGMARRLAYGCRARHGALEVSWDGRRSPFGEPVPPGEYEAVVLVLSDRQPTVRRFPLQVTG